MPISKTIEDFGDMRLAVVPPKFLQMIITSVNPSPGGGNKLDVTYQEWKIFWN